MLMFEPAYYDYVYGAVITTLGALITLVAVFIVFKLQSEKEVLDKVYDEIMERLGLPAYLGKDNITEALEKELNQSSLNVEAKKRYAYLERKIKDHKNSLWYTENFGKLTILSSTLFFLWFIFLLFFHRRFPSLDKGLLVWFIILALLIWFIMRYIMNCIHSEKIHKWLKRFYSSYRNR